MEVAGPIPMIGTPPLSYRFSVVFLPGDGIPNPLDIFFHKVSGITSTVSTTTVQEGGNNLYEQKLPTGIQHDNLVLERGLVVDSPLVRDFREAMVHFQLNPSNVLVTLLDSANLPSASWLFMCAYPVKWSTSDLDADANSVVIETMELAYQQMMRMGVG